MKRLLLTLLLLLPLAVTSQAALAAKLTATWLSFAPVAQLLENTQLQAQSGLELDLPSVAEDGSAVNLSLSFTGQLAADDRIVGLYLFATKNPKPELLSVELLSQQALPSITSRIRLNESQRVIAVALSEQGFSWVSSKEVRVTVSGCLVPNPQEEIISSMHNPRVALPRRIQADQPIEVRTLINHPMETGLRLGTDGELIAQNLIDSLQLSLANQPLMQVKFATGTAANPYVRLLIQPTNQQEELSFSWQDQQGKELLVTKSLP